MSELDIRPATPEDLPAVAEIHNALWPDHATTPESLAREQQDLLAHPIRPHFARFVAERGGRVLGWAGAWQYPGMYAPERHHVELQVRPEAQGGGVGRALADHLSAHLQGLGARQVFGGTQQDQPRALAFLARRGFTERIRYFDSVLDLTAFDPAPWTERAALPAGYTLASLADLTLERGEDAAWAAYHAAFSEVREDVPRPAPATPLTFEAFLQRRSNPDLRPELILFALAPDGSVAALTELWRNPAEPMRLNTGLTGTRRAARRLGLALALKLEAIRRAQAEGARSLITGNASDNRAMLNINEALGFVKLPAWIEMEWRA